MLVCALPVQRKAAATQIRIPGFMIPLLRSSKPGQLRWLFKDNLRLALVELDYARHASSLAFPLVQILKARCARTKEDCRECLGWIRRAKIQKGVSLARCVYVCNHSFNRQVLPYVVFRLLVCNDLTGNAGGSDH